MNQKLLCLRLVEPSGTVTEVMCDSIRLCAKDGANGKGGGFIGIRQGHIPALIALDRGPLTATTDDGQIVFQRPLPGGIASVADNVVTVIGGEDLGRETPS